MGQRAKRRDDLKAVAHTVTRHPDSMIARSLLHRLALPQPRALSYTASTVPSSDVPLNSIRADGDLTWNWKTRLMHSRSHDDDDFPSSLVLMIEI
jgi:hypothetical protein